MLSLSLLIIYGVVVLKASHQPFGNRWSFLGNRTDNFIYLFISPF